MEDDSKNTIDVLGEVFSGAVSLLSRKEEAAKNIQRIVRGSTARTSVKEKREEEQKVQRAAFIHNSSGHKVANGLVYLASLFMR